LKLARFVVSTLAAIGATVACASAGVPLLSRVDWFLIAVAYQAAGGSPTAATVGGAFAGLAEDVLLHPLKGANAFAKALLGYVLAVVSLRLVFAGSLVVAGALAAASLLNELIVILLGRVLLGTPVRIGVGSLAEAALTGAVGGALYWAWRFPWREEWRRRQRRKLR
jgi:rod shape-determining protein MreD